MNSYKSSLNNSHNAVEKRTGEVKFPQKKIVIFFNYHLEFIKSLTPEVSSQAGAIVKLNIPAQIKRGSNEQRKARSYMEM